MSHLKDTISLARKHAQDIMDQSGKSDDRMGLAYSITACMDIISDEIAPQTENGGPMTIFEVLAKAQAEFEPVNDSDLKTVSIKTKNSGTYSYTYSPLDAMQRKTMPSLNKYGLFVRFSPSNENNILSQTINIHYKDEILSTTLTRPLPQDIKEMGGVLTYLARYLYKNELGVIVGGEDQDDSPLLETQHQEEPQPREIIDMLEGERQLQFLRGAKTVKDLGNRWKECSYKDHLTTAAAEWKALILRREATPKEDTNPKSGSSKSPEWLKINGKAHALMAEKAPHLDPKTAHRAIRKLAKVESIKDLDEGKYAELVDMLENKYLGPNEDLSDDTKRAISELETLDLASKEKFWVQAIEPSWFELSIADRLALIEYRENYKEEAAA